MSNRVVYVIESLFSQRDYDRYGIEILLKNGFEVEVWDFTPFLHPRVWQEVSVPDAIAYSGYRRFFTRGDAAAALAMLTDRPFVVCLIPYRWQSMWLYRAMSKCRLNYGLLMVNALPEVCPRDRRAGILAEFAHFHFLQWCNALFRRLPPRLLGIRPAVLVLAGGERSIRRNTPIGRDTTILWAHSHDYDASLKADQGALLADKTTGIFLDEYLPFHPDYVHAGGAPPCSPEEYYPALCRFFTCLERDYGVQIVIAAHPKSHYDEHPEYFGGRPVLRGQTGSLVRQCGFVLAHSSQSINFAVLFKKPVVFVTTDRLRQNEWFGPYIDLTASLLKKTAVNVDAPDHLDWAKESTVDEDAYERYREAYIKRKNTPDKPSWQILADFLKLRMDPTVSV